VVDYTVVLSNPGNVALRSVRLSATGLTNLACGALQQPLTLAVGQSLTCRGGSRFTFEDMLTSSRTITMAVTADGLEPIKLKPVTVQVVYACDTCRTCIDSFASVIPSYQALAGSAKDLAAALQVYCISTGRTKTSCDNLQGAVAASPGGVLGLRAAAVCRQLQECRLLPEDDAVAEIRPGSCKSLAINSTTLEGAPLTNAVPDLCTLQGAAGGDLPPGFTTSQGGWLLGLGECRFACSQCSLASCAAKNGMY
jgi:hypothetical protein